MKTQRRQPRTAETTEGAALAGNGGQLRGGHGKIDSANGWAIAIGDVYRRKGVETLTGLSGEQLDGLIARDELLWLNSLEGETLFPVAQFLHGMPVSGVAALTRDLLGAGLDRYTIAAWFNTRYDTLEGSVWSALAKNGADSAAIKEIVSNMLLSLKNNQPI